MPLVQPCFPKASHSSSSSPPAALRRFAVTCAALLLLLACASAWAPAADAMHVTTHVSTSDQITYLAKFCFDQGVNTGTMWGWTSSSNPAQDYKAALVFVNDVSWDALKSAGNCTNVNSLLRQWQAESAVFWCAPYSLSGKPLPSYCDPHSAPEVLGSNFTMLYSAYTRSRFWFASIVNCDPGTDQPTSIDVDVNMWIVNGDPTADGNDPFQYQFSFEYQGALGLFVAYFIFYVLLVVVHLVAHVRFASVPMHFMIKIFSLSMVLEYCSVLCNLIHFGAYSQDGMGVPGLHDFGTFLQIASQCIFMLLLLTFAKGWSITASHLGSKKVLLGIWTAYSLLYVILFIWMKFGQDPESLDNEYQTWPGGLILTLRCLILVWFIYELRATYRREYQAEKLSFYRIFGVAYTIWFVALPIVVIIAAIVDPRWRYKTITGLFYTVNFVSFACMSWLLWPSRASTYFKMSDDEPTQEGEEDSSALPYDSI